MHAPRPPPQKTAQHRGLSLRRGVLLLLLVLTAVLAYRLRFLSSTASLPPDASREESPSEPHHSELARYFDFLQRRFTHYRQSNDSTRVFPHGFPFVSLLPRTCQEAYWDAVVFQFLALGTRVGGTERAVIQSFLLQPLLSFDEEEGSDDSRGEASYRDFPVKPTLSSAGRALWEAHKASRGAHPSPASPPTASDNCATAGELARAPFSAVWSTSYDDFFSEVPLISSPVCMINYAFHLPANPRARPNAFWRPYPDAAEGKLRERPSKTQHIVLAAHWDTKPEPEGFVGAIDSAVSILLLRQMMQEVQWWKELAQLLRLAISEEREGDKEFNWTAVPEGEVREAITSLLHPTHAALLLQYVFPSGSKPPTPHASLLTWLEAVEELPSLTALFFDGEEAFVDWAGTDHTYGSRHLASVWRRARRCSEETQDEHACNTTWMSSIDAFVLLDLIGSQGSDIWIRNLFPDVSGHLFEHLHRLERSLQEAAYGSRTDLPPLYQAHGVPVLWHSPGREYFPQSEANRSRQHPLSVGKKLLIEDDNMEWVDAGAYADGASAEEKGHLAVAMLSIMPGPFPSQWHTLNDNYDHLSIPSVVHFSILLIEFLFFPPRDTLS